MTNCPNCGGFQVSYGTRDEWHCPKCERSQGVPNFKEEAREWLLRYEGHVAIGRDADLAALLQIFYERGATHGAAVTMKAYTNPDR